MLQRFRVFLRGKNSRFFLSLLQVQVQCGCHYRIYLCGAPE